MNTIINKRFFILPVLLFIVLIFSCTKNENDTPTGVVLYSFGPTGAKPGDTIKFIGVNLSNVTSVEFAGATIDSKNFVSQSSGLITLILPPSAEKGYVTLKAPSGDVVSKTQFNVSIFTGVTSITKKARPGENITITGNYLNWVDRITFADGKTVNAFVSKTINQIVVKIPADAQSGTIILHYGGTDSAYLETKDTLQVTLPIGTTFSPNPVKHATNVTITGTDLDLVKQVLLTGVTNPITSFVSQSATQIVLKVDEATQSGKVTLVAASGIKTVSTTDLNVMLPGITTMSPNPIDAGANLTINGTNLDLVSSITFSNAAAVKTFVSQSATQIVVKVPAGVLRGKVTLGVANSTLTVQSANVLEINGDVPPPTIALPFYLDAVTSNWNGWTGSGWGGNISFSNASPVREGSKSVKIDYVGGWGSPFQLGGGSVQVGTRTTFKLSVYGAPGSAGKTISLGINGAGGKYNISVVEGKWTDYAVPISTLTSASAISEIWIQEYSGTGAFTVFVDAIGLN